MIQTDVLIIGSGRSGYRGGLTWYRNTDQNFELLSTFNGLKINVPALYAAGDRDLALPF